MEKESKGGDIIRERERERGIHMQLLVCMKYCTALVNLCCIRWGPYSLCTHSTDHCAYGTSMHSSAINIVMLSRGNDAYGPTYPDAIVYYSYPNSYTPQKTNILPTHTLTYTTYLYAHTHTHHMHTIYTALYLHLPKNVATMAVDAC